MRVLHVTDAYLPRLGGIEMHVHDLARAQAAAGDEVDIITVTRGRGTGAVPKLKNDSSDTVEQWACTTS